jgi:hypothetical protein
MTIVLAVLGLLLAVALLFIVALLRSHAEILRRLAALESAWDADPTAPPSNGQNPGGVASDISGQTLAGDVVKLSLGPGSPATLLAFMGSGCYACAPLWDELHGEPVPMPAGARLVVVTKGPERERLARLLELAPIETNVMMSTQAWSDFAVPSTPHFVLVRGGEIAGRGAATSWAQITAFLNDAEDDDRIYRARALGTEARAARAERALAEAGIGLDHPSLYPSRVTPAPGMLDAATVPGQTIDD